MKPVASYWPSSLCVLTSFQETVNLNFKKMGMVEPLQGLGKVGQVEIERKLNHPSGVAESV